MTITALDGLTMPSRSQTPTVFDTNADAFAAALPSFATQANALAAALNNIASGSACSIPYTFSTTTTDADPGAGYLRLNNATQNTATVIRADLLGSDGATWTGLIDTFDDSTSTIKGFISLQKASDASKWLLFSISALASPSGYKNITVAIVASSATNPFSDADALLLKFTRNGDKGDTGSTGATGASSGIVLLATQTASGVATIDFTSSIDSTYQEYIIELQNVVPVSAANFQMRTSSNAGSSFDAGASDYMYAMSRTGTGATAAASGSAGATSIALTAGSSISNTALHGGVSGTIRVHDPAGATSYKQVSYQLSGGTAAADILTVSGSAARASATAVNALRFLFSTGNIASGTFKLYGVQK